MLALVALLMITPAGADDLLEQENAALREATQHLQAQVEELELAHGELESALADADAALKWKDEALAASERIIEAQELQIEAHVQQVAAAEAWGENWRTLAEKKGMGKIERYAWAGLTCAVIGGVIGYKMGND